MYASGTMTQLKQNKPSGRATTSSAAASFAEACEWILRLREEPMSGELLDEWLAWCSRSPANPRAFDRALEIWRVTADAPRDPPGMQTDRERHSESFPQSDGGSSYS